MSKERLNQVGVFAACLLLSIILVGFTRKKENTPHLENLMSDKAKFEQRELGTTMTPMTLYKMYYKQELLGYVNDPQKIRKSITDVDSELGLDQDVYFVDMASYTRLEDIDDTLIQFLNDKKLYSMKAYKVTFTNGIEIYVKHLDDFDEARETFILNFVDVETYQKLKRNEVIDQLLNYGEHVTDMSVKEGITTTEVFAPEDEVLKTQQEVLLFLSYGLNPKLEYYTVDRDDTVSGIAWHYGMTPKQIVSINSDQLQSEQQLLSAGMKLNVTRFKSPFTVHVTRERFALEKIDPPVTRYIKDDTMSEGKQVVEQVAKPGAVEKRYSDEYINGTSISSTETSAHVVFEPKEEIIRVGTYVDPSYGSGNFIWPVKNAYVLCAFGCYGGHRGVDLSVYGSGYGPIYASDSGIVVANGYQDDGWGYYIKIDHRNGLQTLYAHMNAPGYFPVGSSVARGTQIGYVGTTGRTSYPHVHFELYQSGLRVNGCSVLGC